MEERGAEHIWAVVNLLQAATLLRDELERGLALGAGVSLAEHDAMMQLLQHGSRMALGELAELLLFTQSGMTRLIDRLEREDLVRREFSREDRRVTYAALTAAGRAKLDVAKPLVRRIVGELFSRHVSDDEVAQLRRIFLAVLRGNGWWDRRQLSHQPPAIPGSHARVGDSATPQTRPSGPLKADAAARRSRGTNVFPSEPGRGND